MKVHSGRASRATCRRSTRSRLRSSGSLLQPLKVLIPGPLRSYTQGRHEVEAAGATLADLLRDLDRAYPGIRFRMIDEQDAVRRHMRIYVNRTQVRDLAIALDANDEVLIIQALSGG